VTYRETGQDDSDEITGHTNSKLRPQGRQMEMVSAGQSRSEKGISFVFTIAKGDSLKGPSRLTISSVHTRRIHTFSGPSTPSTSFNSTPSHQHRRAGLRQNRRSFCAIPTALLFARSFPLISVLNRASAMLHITALLGSPARWPHLSS
jgi:hypothetical protein